MTSSDVARMPGGVEGADVPSTPASARAPERPSLRDKPGAPVIVALPAPLVVRIAQTAWILSLLAGAFAVVYAFIIRVAQLPDIAEAIRGVDGSRAAETYDTAADILFWSVFGTVIALTLVQLTFIVSFSNRRPRMRWWLFGTLVVQCGVLLLTRELVAIGERGQPLVLGLVAQIGLGTIALLVSLLPPALRWTARRHDVSTFSGG